MWILSNITSVTAQKFCLLLLWIGAEEWVGMLRILVKLLMSEWTVEEHRFTAFLKNAEIPDFEYGLVEIGESAVRNLGFGLAKGISRNASKLSSWIAYPFNLFLVCGFIFWVNADNKQYQILWDMAFFS